MKENDPDEFDQAVEFDERNRHNPLAARGKSTADELYLYKHGGPLASANLVADARRQRQLLSAPLPLCDGPCMT